MASVERHEIVLKKQEFLGMLRVHGTVRKACEFSGVARSRYKTWRQRDVDFAEMVDAAFADYADMLQDIMFNRIKNPEKGIGTDSLLIFALQGAKPEVYRPQIMVEQDTAKQLMSEWFKTRKEEKKEEHAEMAEELSEPIERTLEEALNRRRTNSAPEEEETSTEEE